MSPKFSQRISTVTVDIILLVGQTFIPVSKHKKTVPCLKAQKPKQAGKLSKNIEAFDERDVS